MQEGEEEMFLAKPTLVARNLVHTFDQGGSATTVLRGVSVTLHRGELALLMGPSGSGKSTLLSVLSGLLRPTSGRALVLGQDYFALSSIEQERFRQRHFGYIFQGYNLLPALTARQQLELVLRWAEGVPAREARKRAERMLGVLGLGDKTHLRPAQLSGGEKQRVAIGRALVMEPEFCFADEPTSALDWTHGEGVIRLLQEATQKRGTTVLVVSHDARLLPYADRSFHLEDGRLLEQRVRDAADAEEFELDTAGV
jgi:putative ABC transport system ATP-binding protein